MTLMLAIDPEMHRRIAEVLSYVETREWLIDPDMFKIDMDKVHALQQLFRAELTGEPLDPPDEVAVTWDDVFTLHYYAMAAQEYSLRKSEKGLLDITNDHMEELRAWLARPEDRFRAT